MGKARASFEQARRLDPLSGLGVGWVGTTTAVEGGLAAAKVTLERAHALGWRGPASRALFFIAHGSGDGSGATQPCVAGAWTPRFVCPANRRGAAHGLHGLNALRPAICAATKLQRSLRRDLTHLFEFALRRCGPCSAPTTIVPNRVGK